MSLEHSPARQRLRPRFSRIPAALAYGGISKSRLYEWARLRPDLIKKNGTASGVDYDVFDELLDALPVGPARPPRFISTGDLMMWRERRNPSQVRDALEARGK